MEFVTYNLQEEAQSYNIFTYFLVSLSMLYSMCIVQTVP